MDEHPPPGAEAPRRVPADLAPSCAFCGGKQAPFWLVRDYRLMCGECKQAGRATPLYSHAWITVPEDEVPP